MSLPPLLSRLMGLENEYAIRVTVKDAVLPQGFAKRDVWPHMVSALRAMGPVFEAGTALKNTLFVQNGGAFSFEGESTGALIEGATPECRGPLQTLLYQRAQEQQLLAALPHAESALHAQLGTDVELGLVRNARDAEGNLYGPQENYETSVAGPAGHALICALVALGILVLVPLNLILALAVVATLFALIAATKVVDALVPSAHAGQRLDRLVYKHLVEQSHGWLLYIPSMLWCYGVLGRLIHRRADADLVPHLVSRVAVIGVGALLDDGSFVLSERAPFVGALRTPIGPMARVRGLFELGHIIKPFIAPILGDVRQLGRLFRRLQRLQLSSSEANRAQVSELLKLGTTALVLDLSERHMLEDAPRLRDPVGALHTIARDPTLQARVPLHDGTAMTALQLQRWYLTRAQQMVAHSRTPSLEAMQILKLWSDVLDGLERDPRSLVGVLDWPTKQALLDDNADLSLDARKKVAIRYHELGSGYWERFERRGAAVEIVTQEDVARARHTPPKDTPAFARGRAIQDAAHTPLAYVNWERIVRKKPRRAPNLTLVKDE